MYLRRFAAEAMESVLMYAHTNRQAVAYETYMEAYQALNRFSGAPFRRHCAPVQLSICHGGHSK